MLSSRFPGLRSVHTLLSRSSSRRAIISYGIGGGIATAVSAIGQTSTVLAQFRGKYPSNSARALAAGQSGYQSKFFNTQEVNQATITNVSGSETLLAQLADHHATSMSKEAPPDLGELLELRGVVMAVKWADDGSLIDVVATSDTFPQQLAMDAARYGAAITAMAPGLASAYARTTGLTWAPFRSLVIHGGDWAAVVGNDNTGLWVNPADADFNQLLGAMDAL